MNLRASFRLVITHPGRAHRDDLYACGLLLALQPNAPLERRNPAPHENAHAAPLKNGAVVPLVSKPGLAIRQFTSGRVLPGLVVGLGVVLVALLLFRRLVRGWMVLLALVLSGFTAWILLPWASGTVTKVYTLLPAPAANAPGAAQKSGIAKVLSRLIENLPDPQAVAYAAVFVLAFIIVSIALRSAFNRLESRTCP
jgi:hypothetical protein